MTESPPPGPAPDPLAFTPVPGRARHDGWTPERQQRFIAALAAIGLVAHAARSVGMSSKSAYALRRRAGDDSSFVRAWDAALGEALTEAIAIGVERSLAGEQVPVFYRGRQVGSWTRYDDRLALATLRAAAARGPESAREDRS